MAPYWTHTSLRLTTVFEIKKNECNISLPGGQKHILGLKFCRLHWIYDFCPLVYGLIGIIEHECVSIILLHNIKLYLCFKLLFLVHLLIPYLKIVTVKQQLMYECVVQRINLQFINNEITGYCNTFRKETLQQHWILSNKEGIKLLSPDPVICTVSCLCSKFCLLNE